MKYLGFLITIPMAFLALAPPLRAELPIIVNKPLWHWLVLLSGFLAILIWNFRMNVFLKIMALYLFLNCFLSKTPYLSFMAYISFIVCLYYYLLCKKVAGSGEYVFFLKAVQAIFILQVLLVINQVLNSDVLFNFTMDRPVMWGSIGNPIATSSFIICMAPFVLSLSLWNIIPILFVAFATKSSGAILAVMCGISFYVWKMFRKQRIFIILLAIIFAFLFAWKDGAITSFSHGGRLQVWQKTIELIKEEPITGWGIATYKTIFPALSKDVDTGYVDTWNFEGTTGNNVAWRRAHNCWLQILFETGIIGFIIFLGYLGSLLVKYLSSHKSHNVVVLTAAMIMVGSDMLVHYPTRIFQSVLLLVALLAYYEIVVDEDSVNFLKEKGV